MRRILQIEPCTCSLESPDDHIVIRVWELPDSAGQSSRPFQIVGWLNLDAVQILSRDEETPRKLPRVLAETVKLAGFQFADRLGFCAPPIWPERSEWPRNAEQSG